MSNAPSASPPPTPGSATLSHPAFAAVKARFPDVPMRVTEFRGCSTLIVPPAEAHAVLSFLKDEPTLRFDFLSDITAVDYLGYPVAQRSRFAVVYVLRSTQKDLLLIVKTTLDPSLPTDGTAEDPALYLDSVTDLWAGAEWMEREVFDMFGIRFRNHPDLRRILLWETYPGHPLRKDYPLRGRGEREQFRVIDRTDA